MSVRPHKFFGINLEEYIPVEVFPCDADYSFKRGRAWNTTIVPFSPLLEQRLVVAANPLVAFELGFEVMQGDLLDPKTKPAKIWAFFNLHRGRATMFWYFDPAVWSSYPEPYRSDPTTRISHPSDATKGRFIALFDEDEMTSDLFEYRIHRTQLKVSMFPG